MLVYVVFVNNVKTEFSSRGAAEAFALTNGLSVEDVASEEKEIPKKPIPPVTARQLRLQIVLSGRTLAEIEAAIQAQEEPLRSLASIEWEYSSVYEREHEAVDLIGAILGLSSEGLDQMWLDAARL